MAIHLLDRKELFIQRLGADDSSPPGREKFRERDKRRKEKYSLLVLKWWAALFTSWTSWLCPHAKTQCAGLSEKHSSNSSLNFNVNINMLRRRASGNWTVNIFWICRIQRPHQQNKLNLIKDQLFLYIW